MHNCCVGIAKITFKFSLDNSQHSASCHPCGYDYLEQKDARQNQQRQKVHVAKSGGNQAQVPNTALPVESHRMCLISPAKSCENTCECLSMEAH